MDSCITDSVSKFIIEIALALVPLIGIPLALQNRIKTKKGIGKRFIQLLSVLTLVPLIGILGIEGIIEGQLLGGLLGAIVGYTLSDLAKDDITEKSND